MLKNGCANQGLDVTDVDCSKTELEMEKAQPVPVSERPVKTGDTAVLNEICEILKQFQQRQEEQDDSKGCRTNWVLVAMVIDRFLLVVFILLTVIVTCVIILNRPHYSYDFVTKPLDE